MFSKEDDKVKLCVNAYGAVARQLELRRQGAPSQLHYRPRLCPASAHMENYTSPSSKSSSESPVLEEGKRADYKCNEDSPECAEIKRKE